MRLAALLCVLVALTATRPAAADDFYREDVRIAMPAAGPAGLEALLIRPSRPQRYPLALISHGAPRDAQTLRETTPYGFYRQAIEFARRGFAALVVMRRDYGGSGGTYAEGHSCCELRTYLAAAKDGADDLRAAIAAMRMRNDVTTQGMIAVGVSSGGGPAQGVRSLAKRRVRLLVGNAIGRDGKGSGLERLPRECAGLQDLRDRQCARRNASHGQQMRQARRDGSEQET